MINKTIDTAVNWFMNIPVEKRNTLSDKYFPEYAEDGTDLSDDEILIIYKAEHPPLPTTVEYKEVDSLKESYRNACLVALEFGYIQCEKGYNIQQAISNYNKIINR